MFGKPNEVQKYYENIWHYNIVYNIIVMKTKSNCFIVSLSLCTMKRANVLFDLAYTVYDV